MCHLSRTEKLDIVHEVLIKHTSYSDIAALHKIKPHLITVLVQKTKKKEDFFSELKLAEIKKENVNKLIEDTANEILKEDDMIWNRQQVVDRVK